jgi:6-phospho-3-hexuloisomerase
VPERNPPRNVDEGRERDGATTAGHRRTAERPPTLTRVRPALEEITAVLEAVDPAAIDRLCHEILAARRIFCYGAGREGLVVRAFCMRLMHLGLAAHVVGEITAPPIGEGDLLVASSGPGSLSTVLALMGVARDAGARTLVVTAVPSGESAARADVVVHLPAQTMAAAAGEAPSVLPMGTAFEIAELLLFDLVALTLRDLTGQDEAQMRARHTNLE